jgi:hypothetical protein
VLAFVMLPAASIVGFFSTAMSARRESAGYEPGIAVRQLADVVTNVGPFAGYREFKTRPHF